MLRILVPEHAVVGCIHPLQEGKNLLAEVAGPRDDVFPRGHSAPHQETAAWTRSIGQCCLLSSPLNLRKSPRKKARSAVVVFRVWQGALQMLSKFTRSFRRTNLYGMMWSTSSFWPFVSSLPQT